MLEKSSVQEIFDSIRSDLASLMSEELLVGTNDIIFKRVVGGKNVRLRVKKDGNNIGLLVSDADLNSVVTATVRSCCCLPFRIQSGELVRFSTSFMEERELLLLSASKKMASERYSVEVDFQTPTMVVHHSNHLAPTGASPCFSCSNTPFMTCGA